MTGGIVMEDFEFQQDQNHSSPQGYQNKRSDSLGTAAVVLGIIAVVTPYFVYTSFIGGSLAIILGLLSKGGELKTDTRGKIAIVLGIISLVLVTLIVIVAFNYIIASYGGLDNLMDYYNNSIDPFSSYPDTL